MGGFFSKPSKIENFDNTQKYDDPTESSRDTQNFKFKKKRSLTNTPPPQADTTLHLGTSDKYREFGLNPSLISLEHIREHYQPSSLPLIAVITTSTHSIINDSWKLIKNREYDDPDAKDGKVSGSVFFYNTFFRILFERNSDLKIKFPSIYLQATVMSKVIALCASIEYGKLDMQINEIKDLGRMHRTIVQHPWYYSVYVETLHTTFKIALQDDATPEIMKAWANVLSFVLRFMLSEAITQDHIRPYACALNAESAVNENDQKDIESVKAQSENRSEVIKLAKNMWVHNDRIKERRGVQSIQGDRPDANESSEFYDHDDRESHKKNNTDSPLFLPNQPQHNNHMFAKKVTLQTHPSNSAPQQITLSPNSSN